MEIYYTVYKTSNKINGKFYIGTHKTSNLNDTYMGSGKLIKRAIEKYGPENFTKEILFVFDNPNDMFAKEAEIVTDEFLMEENTYNLRIGGEGGFDYINSNPDEFLTEKRLNSLQRGHDVWKIVSEKMKSDPKYKKRILDKKRQSAIIANKVSMENNPNGTFYGKRHSEKTKRIISKKVSNSQSGKGNSQYGTIWITDGTDTKKIKKNDSIPAGWRRGRN